MIKGWQLSQLPAPGPLKVFSCFHCGGGSTMGYRLAGMDVLGGVEIDPQMMKIYRWNHKPKLSYLMGIQEFSQSLDLPAELYKLDILDGSPPCSSFSMSGVRERDWGTVRKFREGQISQILDDLFFHFITLAGRLRPRVVIAENVKGLTQGRARGYVKEILQAFKEIGYECQIFLLNSSRMGVPQVRERVFFIARRKGPAFTLHFDERPISVKEAWSDLGPQQARPLTEASRKIWERMKPGQNEVQSTGVKGKGFNNFRLPWDEPAMTITAKGSIFHPLEPRMLSDLELIRLQTFPDDFQFFCEKTKVQYVLGMSVPPYMIERLARQLMDQM